MRGLTAGRRGRRHAKGADARHDSDVASTRRRPPRAWLRAVVALPTATALAVPVLALTDLGSQSAFAAKTPAACQDSVDGADSKRSRAVRGGSKQAVARKAAERYFPQSQVDMATAVAGAESSWNPSAVNRAAGGNYGLWQINAVHSDLLKGREWQDPEVNAWMAYRVWDAADGDKGDRRGSWTPWSVYTSGSYRAFLAEGARSDVPSEDEAPTDDCLDTGGAGVRVATWNALKSNKTSRITAGTRELTKYADVFGLQELGDSRKRAAAAKGAEGFTMTTDRTAVPILYRTSQYTLLDQGRKLALKGGERVERSRHDGRSVAGRKWVTWAHLQDKTTLQSFYVLNTHMLVGAQNSTKMRKANPRRVALYKRQLATVTALTDAFRADGSAVYVTCDCNVNYSPRVSPIVAMGKHNLVPSWQTLDSPATKGKRAIDYVFSTEAPAAQITGDRNGSDHAFLAVTFLPSATNVILGGSRQKVARTRFVTDPTSWQTYEVPIPAGRAGRAMDFALDQLGDRWAWGAHGADAWDCSGLTAGAWGAAGVSITAQSDAQRRSLRHVRPGRAQPGDIVWRKGYVGIYLGTVGDKRVVLGAVRAQGAVVIHTTEGSDIEAVLRPA